VTYLVGRRRLPLSWKSVKKVSILLIFYKLWFFNLGWNLVKQAEQENFNLFLTSGLECSR